jgi:hypothetical protein
MLLISSSWSSRPLGGHTKTYCTASKALFHPNVTQSVDRAFQTVANGSLLDPMFL